MNDAHEKLPEWAREPIPHDSETKDDETKEYAIDDSGYTSAESEGGGKSLRRRCSESLGLIGFQIVEVATVTAAAFSAMGNTYLLAAGATITVKVSVTTTLFFGASACYCAQSIGRLT